MSQLITLDNVSLAYGLHPLLDKVKLQMNKGERVCLIGRNGAGKSSLLKIVEGELLPDSGSVWRKPHLRIARLAQELPRDITSSVYNFVSEGLAETGKLLAEFHEITQKIAHDHTADDFEKLEKVQHKIDACNGWEYEQQINTILTKLNLDPERRVNELSGGWQRRVALAKAL